MIQDRNRLLHVMAGLVPAIHVFTCRTKDVDDRDKPGHDDGRAQQQPHQRLMCHPLRASVEPKSVRIGAIAS